MTVEQKAQIKSLRCQGVGYGTISKMFGISSNTEFLLPQKQTGKHE